MTEHELINGLQNHDDFAVKELMDIYTPFVSSIIYNVSNGALSTADIEETTADVFIVLWNNSGKIREGSLQGYIASIAKSRTKDKIRRTKKHFIEFDIEEVMPADEHLITDDIDRQILQKDLEDAMDTLDEPDKEILMRYYYYYQTAPKIAEVMSLKLEAVKSKIKRGRKKLKAFLEERGY